MQRYLDVRFFHISLRQHAELQIHGTPSNKGLITDHPSDEAIPSYNHKVWIDALRPDFDEYIARARQDEDSESHPQAETQKSSTCAQSHSSELRKSLLHLSLDGRVTRILQGSHQTVSKGRSSAEYQNSLSEPITNILAYLGLNEGNWAMVSWITRVITEHAFHEEAGSGSIMGFAPLLLDHRSHLPPPESQSIEELANNFIWFKQNIPESRQADNDMSKTSLDVPKNEIGFSNLVTRSSRHIGQLDSKSVSNKDAIGIILNALGQMIMHASESSSTAESQDIMNHVLDTMAILHHNGIIPEFTYRATPSGLYSAMAPPPYFDELFNPLLSSILDAEWNLFQDTPEHASYASGAQAKIPGFQFGDHHNPKRILPFSHGIWLELILWICLRGGYLQHGLSLLQQIASTQDTDEVKSWTITSWRDSAPATPDGDFIIPNLSISAELLLSYANATIDLDTCVSEDKGASTRQRLKLLQDLHARSEGIKSYDWSSLSAQITGYEEHSTSEFGLSESSKDRAWRLEQAAISGDFSNVAQIFENLIVDINASKAQKHKDHVVDLADYIPTDVLGRVIQAIDDSGGISTVLRHSIRHVLTNCSVEQLGTDDVLGPALITFLANNVRTKLDKKVEKANKLMRTFLKHDNFKLAQLVQDVSQQKPRKVKQSLESILGQIHIAEDWHQRILVAMIRKIMALQSKNAGWTGEISGILTLQNLKDYLTHSIQREDMSHLLPSTYTIIGLLASVNESWMLFCNSLLLESLPFFRTHSDRPRSFLHHTPGTQLGRIKLIKATFLPNLCAKLFATIANIEGVDAVLRIWKQWCQMPDSKTQDTRSKVIIGDVAVLIIQTRLEPTPPMIRILVNFSDLDSNAEERESITAMLRHLEYSDQAIREMLEGKGKPQDDASEERLDSTEMAAIKSSLKLDEDSVISELVNPMV